LINPGKILIDYQFIIINDSINNLINPAKMQFLKIPSIIIEKSLKKPIKA